MTHRHIATLCLLALAAAHLAALAAPLVSFAAADCCSRNMCPMQKPASKDSSDCHHSSETSDCACSISAGHMPQTAAIGHQPYVPAAQVVVSFELPLGQSLAEISFFAATTALDIESPPPRTILL
jgi:hypothetical protein